MPAVMERTTTALPPEAINLPTVEYPEEVVARWDREDEITDMLIAAGELRPMSIAEIAARVGLQRNGK